MASRDMKNNVAVYPSVNPGLSTVSTTTAALAADTINYEGVTVLVNVGAISAACIVNLSMVESDTVGGSYTAVALTDLIDNSYPAPLTNANANSVAVIGYRGNKRFVKAQVVLSGTVGTGCDAGAIIVLSHGRHQGGNMVSQAQ